MKNVTYVADNKWDIIRFSDDTKVEGVPMTKTITVKDGEIIGVSIAVNVQVNTEHIRVEILKM